MQWPLQPHRYLPYEATPPMVWSYCLFCSRQLARVTRADRRRMVELREETGVQRSFTERLVRSRLQWAGHVERMADDRLPKRAAELREQGRRRRGRPRLRWEDCVKRDVKNAGEEGDWKKKTQDRVGWKRLADEAVKKLQASPHPWQREKEEERDLEQSRIDNTSLQPQRYLPKGHHCNGLVLFFYLKSKFRAERAAFQRLDAQYSNLYRSVATASAATHIPNGLEQSMRFCSDSTGSTPVIRKVRPSSAPLVANAQHAPQ